MVSLIFFFFFLKKTDNLFQSSSTKGDDILGIVFTCTRSAFQAMLSPVPIVKLSLKKSSYFHHGVITLDGVIRGALPVCCPRARP